MAKDAWNLGKGWTSSDVKAIKQLAKEITPTRVLELNLGLTLDAFRKAGQEVFP